MISREWTAFPEQPENPTKIKLLWVSLQDKPLGSKHEVQERVIQYKEASKCFTIHIGSVCAIDTSSAMYICR